MQKSKAHMQLCQFRIPQRLYDRISRCGDLAVGVKLQQEMYAEAITRLLDEIESHAPGEVPIRATYRGPDSIIFNMWLDRDIYYRAKNLATAHGVAQAAIYFTALDDYFFREPPQELQDLHCA